MSPASRLLQTVLARAKSPYVVASSALILTWLALWLASFHNLYGWLTDDATVFSRVVLYERGGENIFDIQWFHAYMWLVLFLPWTFHWTVPSHDMPRAWQRTAEFRALILYVIFLHAIFLAIVAYFFRTVCKNALLCFGAFVLFVTSPTLLEYADLLDSRFLGLLAGLPSALILMHQFPSIQSAVSRKRILLGFFLAGFLLAVGQAIHYTEWYFNGPLSAAYWVLALSSNWRSSQTWRKLTTYVAGIVAWFAPVQWLSLRYHGFGESMIGTMIFQVDNHLSPYGRGEDFVIWLQVFRDAMGLPMIVAVACGAVVLSFDRLRPAYIGKFHAQLMVWTTVIASAYFLATPAFPFYRQVSGLQLFYALFAMVAIERSVWWISRTFSSIGFGGRIAIGTLLFLAVAFVPSVLRGSEVFAAQQGLGRAVNYAYERASAGHVFFIATYDWDEHPKALVSRADFDRLSASDYIVTDYPIFFHVKYPDLFALMHDTKPLASFPTLWCTQENYAELRAFFAFRRWDEEPENCESQVFSVAQLRAEAAKAPLEVTSIRADSTLSASHAAERALAIRNPQTGLDDNYFGRGMFDDLWASKASSGTHWIEVTFARPEVLGAVTIVPADFKGPPDYKNVGRIASLTLLANDRPGAALKPVWSGRDLENDAIFTATFAARRIATLRFEIATGAGNGVACLEYIRFPGHTVHLTKPAKALGQSRFALH